VGAAADSLTHIVGYGSHVGSGGRTVGSPSSLAGLFLPILTSMFLHPSWLHIIGDMWVLWIFGDNIEDYLGHFPYLLFYLVSGFAAALAHILLNAGSNVPTGLAGAGILVLRAVLERGGYFDCGDQPDQRWDCLFAR
jgi:membrane associated rhomboid family serine protease